MSTDRSEWIITEVPPRAVRPLIVGNHYLHRMPAVTPCALALSVDGLMVAGAMLWSVPPRETGPATWELSRLWLADELPRNSESWFIARGIRHIRREHPEIKRLVSYADPAEGHRGTIYYASNWLYEGMTDADRKTPRFDYFVGARRLGRASHGQGLAVTKVRRQPKHRFSYQLRTLRARIEE